MTLSFSRKNNFDVEVPIIFLIHNSNLALKSVLLEDERKSMNAS